jgi:hypothetical protein
MIFSLLNTAFMLVSTDVLVFAQHHSLEDLKRNGIEDPHPVCLTTYKLFIDDYCMMGIGCLKS